MKNKILLTFIFTLLFGMVISPSVLAAEPAEGFDPADEMYIKANTEHYWKGCYSNGRVFTEYIAKELVGELD